MADQTEASLWQGPDAAYERLKSLLEISHPDEGVAIDDDADDNTDDDGEEAINPASARASALPIVKLFAFGTYLLRLSPRLQPFACVAFGSVDTAVYVDIFWEAIAEVDDARIRVYEVHEGSNNVVFELSFGGHEFRVLYHKCNDLLRSYPDIVSAPSNFLKNPANGCLHVCDLVETLKSDQKHLRDPNMDVVQHSFDLIRAWALSRGRMGLGEAAGSHLKPKEILHIIFSYISSVKGPANALDCFAYFLRVVDFKYSGPMVSAKQLPLDLTSPNEPNLRAQLEKVPLRDVMVFRNYLQISVVFTCSRMRGSQWLSMVEQRLWTIPKSGLNGTHKYAVWPTRLISDSTTNTGGLKVSESQEPYEGFYVVGYNQDDFIIDAVNKAIQRAAKDKDTVQGECFLSVKSIPFAEFDTVFNICQQHWPRKPIPNPLEKDNRAQSLDLPIRSKTKKVHKDGKKAGKESSTDAAPTALEPDENHTNTNALLRPASQVLTRLKHDARFDIDEFVVGYEDRHSSKMQEKAAASWQRDTTHEEFIPEHRIQYFRQTGGRGGDDDEGGEIMWDRRSRMDKIFKEGSGGGEA